MTINPFCVIQLIWHAEMCICKGFVFLDSIWNARQFPKWHNNHLIFGSSDLRSQASGLFCFFHVESRLWKRCDLKCSSISEMTVNPCFFMQLIWPADSCAWTDFVLHVESRLWNECGLQCTSISKLSINTISFLSGHLTCLIRRLEVFCLSCWVLDPYGIQFEIQSVL